MALLGALSSWRFGRSRTPRLSTLLEGAARLGYAARGLVYVGLGAVVLLAAVDLTPRATGAKGLMRAWADWPLGALIIAALGCGLAAFAVWRALQAVFDADQHGDSPKAWAVRAGQAISGLVYGGLAYSAFELLDVFEDIGEADEEQSAHRLAGAILDAPHGDTLLVAAGLVVLGFGVGNIVQGMMQDFARRLACDARVQRWVVPLAKAGYAARGLATIPLGFFLVRAGLEARAGEARSWGQALQTIEQQPFGSWALGLVAAGLIAFGLFGFVEAAYRRIRSPDAVTG